MFRVKIRYYILFLFSLILINNQTLAHHKSKLTKTISTEWKGDKKSKSEYLKQAKTEYCAIKTEAITVPGKPIMDLNKTDDDGNPIQRKDEDGKPEFEDETYKIKIIGFHSNNAKKAGKVLKPNQVNGLNFNKKFRWPAGIKLIDVLKEHCLQDSTKPRPLKFSGSYLEKFYENIAFDNGYLTKDGKKGDYNQQMFSGPNNRGPIEGRDIMKDGIMINNPNAVWYVPDFLEKDEKRLIKKSKEKKDEAERIQREKKKKEARQNAEKDGNEQWISANKRDFIDQFKKKLKEYQKIIDELDKKRENLNSKIKEHEKLVNTASKAIRIAFDDLRNRENADINKIKNEIRDNEEQHLIESINKNYQEEVKKINDKDFESYPRFKTLKKLIDRAEKSEKATDFVGKDGFKITLPKILGGGKRNLTSDKIGFIKEFENIQNRKLGSGSDDDLEKIIKITKNVGDQLKLINDFIINKVEELNTLDQNLTEKNKQDTQIYRYIIYFVIFLVIAGIGTYIFLQRREMNRIKRESEEKVGSLKSDFENKLKDTSEQIKSVSKTAAAARSQQAVNTSIPEPVEETPKTPEEIIAIKYEELVSDYNEALNDFSKVATFKQKWNGLALSRKERQDGSKTILISASRAFEKAGIWCVSFDDKYFAFPGSTVKSNMATYMNMDFMKASQDFKGVFGITTGSTYSTETAVLRKSGAGFVVERAGKIAFPD